jgi:hypothetical protein
LEAKGSKPFLVLASIYILFAPTFPLPPALYYNVAATIPLEGIVMESKKTIPKLFTKND